MYKTITVKVAATLPQDEEFKEYEFPTLKNYLDDGWDISNIHQSTTEENVGFVFLTYVLFK